MRSDHTLPSAALATGTITGAAEILVPTPLGHGFTYRVPEGMPVTEGSIVSVPFGNRELPGIVWKETDALAFKSGKLKAIGEHHAHLPPLSTQMCEFIRWVAWYTCTPVGAIVKMVLPVATAVKPQGSRERPTLSALAATPVPAELSPLQQGAAGQLADRLKQGFSVTLLDGVTGSGKTEVYFDSIARILAESQGQALVLLPEIALSVQWLERFTRRFGFAPQVWHSGLTRAARKHGWRAVTEGKARIVVGARSALFLPYRDLRLIVVDEEHESSYKQEDIVIYHARDMAIARAKAEKIPVVLASATPSLETHANAQSGRYAHLTLPARHGGASFPEVTLVDMRNASLEKGAFISTPLRNSLAHALSLGHQSMLFLNRRGYAPLVLCRSCGHRFQCAQCTAWLVMHKHHPRLQCHHCGYTLPIPKHCPACQSEETLHPCGPGVERIAEEVAQFLPQARISVMASDSAENYEELQQRIHAMERGAVDIMIGTQMVAKGHHFANLALVGVVDADLGLNGGDIRAGERTYQLLHQLSGRAGREQVAGNVLVQSFAPEHPVMQALVGGDRDAFLALESEMRKRAQMPPFTRLAALILEGVQEEATAAFARDLARAAPKVKELQLLGPAPAPLYQLRGKYRQRLLLKAERQVNVQAYIGQWLERLKAPSSIRIKIDIDPQSFL